LTHAKDSFVVTAIGIDGVDGVTRRWLEPVARSWPAGEVRAKHLTPDQLAAQLELDARDSHDRPCSPLLIVAANGQSGRVCQLIDSLHLLMIPAIVLYPSVTPDLRRHESDGVIVASHETAPEILAGMLYALSRRQQTVRRVASELRVSQAAQGGVSGAIQRLQDELSLAADVQKEFLPSALPEVEGLEFGVIFRPVGYVSGDVYDLFVIDERTVGFFIADVVGHGVPAALLTVALCRGLETSERTGAGVRVRPPHEVLARLNDDLVSRQLSGQRFATAIYGVIDRVTHRVTMSSAGHPPPLLVSPGGVREVDSSGPLLGVFPDAEFDDIAFDLGADESLVLYTDGMETAFPEAGQFVRPTKAYRERFSRLIEARHVRGLAMSAAMQEIADELDNQSGSLHGVDDITSLAIARPLPRVCLAAA
jgi:phosphoserine phosphatase RsbU/P